MGGALRAGGRWAHFNPGKRRAGREGRQGGQEKRTRKQEGTHKFSKYIMEKRVKEKRSPENTGM